MKEAPVHLTFLLIRIKTPKLRGQVGLISLVLLIKLV